MKKIEQFKIWAIAERRLRNAGFDLKIEYEDAVRDGEIVAVADNELLRAVRRLTGHRYERDGGGASELYSFVAERFRILKGGVDSETNRARLCEINRAIKELTFVGEIVTVTSESKRAYIKVGKSGFKLNGRKYVRLMCSAAMARTNRALFCAEDIFNRLDEILRCGAKDVKIVPAKWNAYYSLPSSATFRVSMPRVCVVKDLEIEIENEVDWAEPHEHEDTIERKKVKTGFNLWDGMGLISPELSMQWSEQVGYEGIAESFIVRAPFVKGLVATFDFKKFAKEVAEKEEIVDIYGKVYKVDDVDLILTESQFKLWNAYDSMDDYLSNLSKYGFSWGVARVGAPDSKRVMRTNYQFLQVLNMQDDDIAEVCEPTLEWLKGVSGCDYTQKVLYCLGKLINKKEPKKIWNDLQDSAIKALLLEPQLVREEYLTKIIVNSIKKKMKESYIGKLIVDGGFNFLYFDPYALCEYIFGLQVKGLLERGEAYADFWSTRGENEIVAMRSPMTWRAEVALLKLQHSEKMQEWYQYIGNGVILNVWGNERDIFSGADADGDLLATTNNAVFKRCRYGGVPVIYEHKKASKEIIER